MVLLDIGDILIYIGKWGSIIGFILAFVVFGVWNLIKFPKMIVKGAIAVVGLIVVIVIAYLVASGETTILGKDYTLGASPLSSDVSKRIGAGLIGIYILGGIAFVLLVVDIIKGFLIGN